MFHWWNTRVPLREHPPVPVEEQACSILLSFSFAHELQKDYQKELTPESVFQAVKGVFENSSGGYAVVSMILNKGLVAFRDPNGIRPIVIGTRESDQGTEYMVASESVALDVLGYELLRDILPGEAIFIDAGGNFSSQQCVRMSGTGRGRRTRT